MGHSIIDGKVRCVVAPLSSGLSRAVPDFIVSSLRHVPVREGTNRNGTVIGKETFNSVLVVTNGVGR